MPTRCCSAARQHLRLALRGLALASLHRAASQAGQPGRNREGPARRQHRRCGGTPAAFEGHHFKKRPPGVGEEQRFDVTHKSHSSSCDPRSTFSPPLSAKTIPSTLKIAVGGLRDCRYREATGRRRTTAPYKPFAHPVREAVSKSVTWGQIFTCPTGRASTTAGKAAKARPGGALAAARPSPGRARAHHRGSSRRYDVW